MNLVVACMSCVGGDVLHKDGQKARGWDLAGAALKKTTTLLLLVVLFLFSSWVLANESAFADTVINS